MTDISPFFLALAFIFVGAAAWLLGRRSVAARVVRLPRDYYVGLDHLINDRFDSAAEIFARVAQVDGDAAEIQFALGSLFRRRGEVDRAIAIHTRLIEQGSGTMRERAAYALALDYLSAGLMDRAERLFEQLSLAGEYRDAALEHLGRIYEQQGDWANALKVFHELPPPVQSERRREAAHYLCELAEHALLQGDTERVRSLLRQVHAHDNDLPRAQLLTARMLENTDEARTAFDVYLRVLESSPGLALEIIPRALRIAAQIGEQQAVDVLTTCLRRTGKVSSRQVAWLLATALPPQDVRQISGMANDLIGSHEASGDASSLGALLTRIGDAGGRYQCEDCGLHSVRWYWRCPKCRTWDSLRPAVFKWAERTEEARAN